MPKPILTNGILTHQVSRPTDTLKIAAIYARVSTTDQADKGYSLPTQLEACQAMARQEGYAVPDTHVFVDDYTGTSLNRPQFTQLRDLVRQRLVQAVLVHDLDRLSRKLAHQLLLSDEFEQAGVVLRIVTMPEGTKTPEAQLLSNVHGIIAEYERAKILERTARGRRGRAQAGYVPYGRRTLGYVYVKHADQGDYYDQEKGICRACGQKGDKGACYVVHPEESALVQRIFQLYVAGGLAQDAIAARLTAEGVPTPGERRPGPARRLPAGVWHQSTVADILRNTAYIGTLYDGKTQNLPGKSNPDKKTRHRVLPRDQWIAVPVPAIIPDDTFHAAQALMTRNRHQARRNRKHAYLLVGGRLRCGQCRRAMTGETGHDRQARYRCGRKTYQDVGGVHTRRSVLASEVESRGWSAVERALNNPALIAAELERRREGTSTQQADLDRERQHYARQLAQCERDLKKSWDAYLSDAITLDYFKGVKATIDTRLASAERELARLDAEQHAIEQAELEMTALTDYCARVWAQLQHFTLEEKQRVLEVLNIAVTWHPTWPEPQIEGSLPPEIFAIATSAVR